MEVLLDMVVFDMKIMAGIRQIMVEVKAMMDV